MASTPQKPGKPRTANPGVAPAVPPATSVRSTRSVMIFIAVLWAIPVGSLLAILIAGTVAAATDASEPDVAVRLTAGALVLVPLALVTAGVGRLAWRHVGRSARPTPDGTGLVLRGFRFRRTVSWDDVLGVGAEASQVDAAEGTGTLDHTIVLVRRPGRAPEREVLDSRAVVVAAGFGPRPEVTATLRSWAPPGHPVRDGR